MYSFRYRFEIAPGCALSSDETVLRLGTTPDGHELELASPSGEPISQTRRLVLRSSGWRASDEAEKAGKVLSDKLALAFAKHRIGVELWKRRSSGVFTDAGLEMLGGGERVLNDSQGLMVYTTHPAPRFASVGASVSRGTSPDGFVDSFQRAIRTSIELEDKERIALDLFNASFFEPASDTRFITLVIAIEALIQPRPRSTAATDLVNAFIEQVVSAELTVTERNSLAGSLRWLRSESIRGAGRRLVAERLKERQYGGQSAESFFARCYDIRSRLVHGNDPREAVGEVRATVADLEVLVSDLLTESYWPKTTKTPV